MSFLSHLDVSSNMLEHLPTSVWHCQSLVQLNAASNRLESLPDSISGLSNLTTLNVSRNQLSKIPSTLGQLVKLNEFQVARNQLHELPSTMMNLTQLKILNIGDNNHQRARLPSTKAAYRKINERVSGEDAAYISAVPTSEDLSAIKVGDMALIKRSDGSWSYAQLKSKTESVLVFLVDDTPHESGIPLTKSVGHGAVGSVRPLPVAIGTGISFGLCSVQDLNRLFEALSETITDLRLHNIELEHLPTSILKMTKLKKVTLTANSVASRLKQVAEQVVREKQSIMLCQEVLVDGSLCCRMEAKSCFKPLPDQAWKCQRCERREEQHLTVHNPQCLDGFWLSSYREQKFQVFGNQAKWINAKSTSSTAIQYNLFFQADGTVQMNGWTSDPVDLATDIREVRFHNENGIERFGATALKWTRISSSTICDSDRYCSVHVNQLSDLLDHSW
jgi:hypothetical protein